MPTLTHFQIPGQIDCSQESIESSRYFLELVIVCHRTLETTLP